MQQTMMNMAGLDILVEHRYDILRKVAADYPAAGENADFAVSVTEADIDAERCRSRNEYAYEGLRYPNHSPEYLESTAAYRKIAQKLPDYQALVFHGSAVAVADRAFLFTAVSGTGKTTHTNLWLKNIDGSYIVNGDKPILRLFADGVKVCGTPWRGKERLGSNLCVPLQAICLLRRGETNTIREIPFAEAMPVLVGQTYRSPDRAALVKTLRILETVGKSVKLYALSCTMDDEAAWVSYRGMCR